MIFKTSIWKESPIFRVKRYVYNGFMGHELDGLTNYSARFIGWTYDPGVGVFRCSDGTERAIPTFALIWRRHKNKKFRFPEQPKTGTIFGIPSKSE